MHPFCGLFATLLAENSLLHLVGQAFHPIFVVVATVLAAIYGVVPSYGLAIILLTIIVMAPLLPLTIKSIRSTQAMQRLQPEMSRLRQKYTRVEDREELGQALTQLYREHGVSPAAGCIPLLLQIPLLIVLYDVIRGLSNMVATTRHGHTVVLAAPRYIPASSRMYHDLVATHGAMHSFGLNLALSLWSFHTAWLGVLPYLTLVLLAVVLQYVQMVWMSKRAGPAAPANPEMPTVSKLIPLVLAPAYILVPAAVIMYTIVSSGIRIGVQGALARASAHARR
jgi:YidC/Oxa1 family membrane protein insertase